VGRLSGRGPGDRSLIRIYSHGELIKTHPRQKPGGRSTDFTDYPDGRAPYACDGQTSIAIKRESWEPQPETSPTDSWKESFPGAACGKLRS
jgi:hypothetical protein